MINKIKAAFIKNEQRLVDQMYFIFVLDRV